MPPLLMYALYCASRTLLQRGDYAAANLLIDELVALADEKGALFWKAQGMCTKVAVCPDRQNLGRGSNDHRRHHRTAVNRNNYVDPEFFVMAGEGPCGPRPIR